MLLFAAGQAAQRTAVVDRGHAAVVQAQHVVLVAVVTCAAWASSFDQRTCTSTPGRSRVNGTIASSSGELSTTDVAPIVAGIDDHMASMRAAPPFIGGDDG